MTPKHIVAVIDYGSQYTQLFVRRVQLLKARQKKQLEQAKALQKKYAS